MKTIVGLEIAHDCEVDPVDHGNETSIENFTFNDSVITIDTITET